MKIVYASSEMAPFASTGRLADAGDALPALMNKLGAEVIRIMPLYRCVVEGRHDLAPTGIVLDIPMGLRSYGAEVWLARHAEPPTYFIRRDEFFDRSYLYGIPERDYDDNFDRFVFFQKAVVSLMEVMGWRPDIVHCNDWQTGLLPLFLQHGINGMGRNRTERVLFTFHDVNYQGVFPGSQYSLTNLPFFCFNVDVLEYFGKINCLKAGLTSAQRITTVSRTYAGEVKTETFGHGLHGVLAGMGMDRMSGIVNGIDYSIWNPAADPHLACTYSADNLEGKTTCRHDLARELGLLLVDHVPLISLVERFDEEHGCDLLIQAAQQLMALDVRVIVQGMGHERFESEFNALAAQWPGRFVMDLDCDTNTLHKVYAASDFLLMPSRYEPCGVSQLCGLRYGAIPIAHATGGLEDTIDDLGQDGTHGTGIKFHSFTVDALIDAVKRACAFHQQHELMRSVIQRAMTVDFSWNRTAQEYHQLYHSMLI